MVPLMPSGSGTPLRCRRYVYGYALDNSEFPCYLVWPERYRDHSYLILDTSTEDVLTLEENSFFRPLGIQHFYDSFAFESHLSIRQDAVVSFGLQDDELSDDLSIAASAVLRKRWGDHQERPIDQNAPEANRQRVPADVIHIAPQKVEMLGNTSLKRFSFQTHA